MFVLDAWERFLVALIMETTKIDKSVVTLIGIIVIFLAPCVVAEEFDGSIVWLFSRDIITT